MQQSVFDPTLLGASSLLRVRSKILFDRGTFLVLLALIGLTATPLGAAEIWWSPVFECVVFALTAIWAIECLVSDSWGPADHRLALPLIVLAVFAFIQSLPLWGPSSSLPFGEGWVAISADPYETKRVAVRLLALAFLLALLLRHTSTRARHMALVSVVVVVGLASSLWVLVPRAGAFAGVLDLRSIAGFGQFDNHNHFAFLMEMVIGLIMGIVIRAGLSWRVRLLCLLLVVPLWFTLILTRSRGGVLALAGAVLFLVFMFSFSKPIATSLLNRGIRLGRRQVSGQFITKFALAGGLLIALLGSVIMVGGDRFMKRLERVPIEFSLDGRTGGNRIDIWQATWRSIKAHPLLGSGFGAYKVAIPAHHDASGKWVPEQAHNDYLELLSSGGLVGGAVGVWFVIIFIKRSRNRLRSADAFQSAACLGALAGIVAVAIHSLFDFGLHISANAIIFVALVVIATAGVKGTNGRVSEGNPRANHFHTRPSRV